METKEKYLEQAEIKVKNLLAYLYEDESDTLKEISKTRETLNQRITDLEKKHADITKQRKELQEKFNHLKDVGDNQWTKTKEDFELTLKYVEGDKESFIQKAEGLITEIGSKIQELEDRAVDAATEVRADIDEKVKDLKISREELRSKVNRIKKDTGEHWKEIRRWFVKKSKSVKEYITSIGQD